jgi:hypothetical protein
LCTGGTLLTDAVGFHIAAGCCIACSCAVLYNVICVCCCSCLLQPDDLASIRSILPKPEELQDVRNAKRQAEQKLAAAAGASPRTPPAAAAGAAAAPAVTPSTLSPRLGIVEAAFDALGGVELLQAKMRAMEFRWASG